MKFYRVNKNGAQRKVCSNSRDFLVGNELLTQSEINKTNLTKTQIKKYFDIVQISKFRTHWFFGARFENTLDKL